MKKNCYVGLDIGGTGAKAGVFDRAGKMLSFSRRGYQPRSPAAGQAELPIQGIESAARFAVREAVRAARAAGDIHIRAMAVSSQGQTFVTLDHKGKPLHPAIIWYDTRATRQAEILAKRLQPHAGDANAPPIQPIASAAKIMWLREHKPAMLRNAASFLLLPDYFARLLTGRAVTDQNTASTTGLCASGSLEYFRPALEAAEIKPEQLAEIRPSGTAIGRILPEQAKAWNLSPETLLAVGTNDQYAGALGAGLCKPSIVSLSVGTCLAMVTLTAQRPLCLPSGLFSGKFPLPPFYFLLAYSKTAGLALEWFNRELAPKLSLSKLDALAKRAKPGCMGLSAIPWFDGAVSPRPNPAARAAFYGLTLSHSLADMYRALLESLAFSARENLELLHSSAGATINKLRATSGGAKSKVWLQILADATGLNVEQPAVTETSTLGSAMLAAAGCGDFVSLAEATKKLYCCKRLFRPNPALATAYEQAYTAYRKAADAVLQIAAQP